MNINLAEWWQKDWVLFNELQMNFKSHPNVCVQCKKECLMGFEQHNGE